MENNVILKARLSVRNKILWDLMKSKGIKSLAELGRKLDVHYQTLLRVSSLECKTNRGAALKALEKFFGVPAEYIYPEEFCVIAKKKFGCDMSKEIEIPASCFVPLDTVPEQEMLVSNTEDPIENEELRLVVRETLNTITNTKLVQIIKERFGLENEREHSLEELAEKYNTTRENIRQKEMSVLRKLRHPIRSNRLKNYLES